MFWGGGGGGRFRKGKISKTNIFYEKKQQNLKGDC